MIAMQRETHHLPPLKRFTEPLLAANADAVSPALHGSRTRFTSNSATF